MWSASAAVFLLLLQNPDHSAQGIKALEEQNYEAAAGHFTKAVEAAPDDYASWFHLALAKSFLGKDEEAIAGYRKVLALKPGLYQAELNLGMVLLRGRQAREAIPHLEAAASAKPQEYRPRFYLAEALFQAGEFPRAEEAYRAAAALDPKSGGVLLGLARSLARQNRMPEAEPHFRRAAELDPGSRDGLLELAVWFEQNNRPADAIAIYRQFPDNVAATERLGQLLVQTGDAAAGLPHLEQAVRDSPTAANRLALAQAYRKAGQPDKTLAMLDQALRAGPDDLDLRMAYGRELRDQRKFASAAEQFLYVVERRPDSVEAWNEFSAMLISLEDFPKALAALDRVRALGGETAGHLYLRAIVLDKMRDLKPALESYERFLALSQGKNPNEEFKARQRARIIRKELDRR
jgi:tetratricopeptide (TPR) repeat protein